MRPAEELLYDSEASFRLVDHAIQELSATGAELAGMLDSTGIEKLQEMHGHLREVTSATEVATHGILDGLGRAVALVEKLDADTSLSDADRHRMVSSLREELGGVVNHLQFQDITSQQLKHIELQLADMNRRITQVAKIFAPPAATFAKRPDAVPALEMNMVHDPEAGQAVADEIFAIKAERKTA